MAKHRFSLIDFHLFTERRDQLEELIKIKREGVIELLKQLNDLQCFVIKIKRPRRLFPTRMKLSNHEEGFFNMNLIVIVKINAAVDVMTNLPALIRILVNKGIV